MSLREDRRVAASLAVVNDAITVSHPGSATVGFQLSGTWVGTVTFEAVVDDTAAANWTAVSAFSAASGAAATTATANGIYLLPCGGYRAVRARFSTATSGTIAAVALASSGRNSVTTGAAASTGTQTVQGVDAAGAAITGRPVLTGINDGGGLVRPTAGVNQANGTAGNGVQAVSYLVWDGAAFRKVPDITSITGTVGVGLPGHGPALWDLAGGVNYVRQAGDGSGRSIVVGAAAAGAAIAGNPVQVGGSDGTLTRALLVDTSGRPLVAGAAAAGAAIAGNPVAVGGTDGTNAQYLRIDPGGVKTSLGTTTSGADGVSNNLLLQPQRTDGTGSYLGVMPLVSNGVTWDRPRNNFETIIQASGVTTVQTINTDIVTYNAAKLMVHVNVTLYNGGTLTVKLQWKDANGLFVDIPLATTGGLTTGADILMVLGAGTWPANTATAFYTNFPLPRQVRIVTTIAAASITFSSAYALQTN